MREYNLFRPWLKKNIHQTHRQFCFAYQLTGLYIIRGFTERYFPADYSYILENHFYFVIKLDYCFKPSLSRIFCVSSSVKVLSPLYEGPSTHLFRISSKLTLLNINSRRVMVFIRNRNEKLFCDVIKGELLNFWRHSNLNSPKTLTHRSR